MTFISVMLVLFCSTCWKLICSENWKVVSQTDSCRRQLIVILYTIPDEHFVKKKLSWSKKELSTCYKSIFFQYFCSPHSQSGQRASGLLNWHRTDVLDILFEKKRKLRVTFLLPSSIKFFLLEVVHTLTIKSLIPDIFAKEFAQSLQSINHPFFLQKLPAKFSEVSKGTVQKS